MSKRPLDSSACDVAELRSAGPFPHHPFVDFSRESVRREEANRCGKLLRGREVLTLYREAPSSPQCSKSLINKYKDHFITLDTNDDIEILSTKGTSLVRVFRRIVPNKHVSSLHECAKGMPYKGGLETSKRGKKFQSIKGGFWRKTPGRGKPNAPYATSDFKREDVQAFVLFLRCLWFFVSKVFAAWAPMVYARYMQSHGHFPKMANPLLQTPFGAFALMILNWGHLCSMHVDPHDYKGGYCVVIPFGEYIGGNLQFPELGVSIKLNPGDLVFFDSASLLHGNEAVEQGTRHSCVLITHQNVMFNPNQDGYDFTLDDLSEDSDDNDE